MTMWDPSGLLVAFPVVTYGFTAHQVLFSIYGSLRSGGDRAGPAGGRADWVG